jgi:hypothetical protein
MMEGSKTKPFAGVREVLPSAKPATGIGGFIEVVETIGE